MRQLTLMSYHSNTCRKEIVRALNVYERIMQKTNNSATNNWLKSL